MMLYIVRHGETDWNKERKVQGYTDIPLNDYGRHLAEETAEGMEKIHIDLGYTSPLSRAKETAQIILKDRGIPLIEDDRIKEMGFGSYEGMRSSGEDRALESDAFNKFFTDTENYIPPLGGESVSDLYARTGAFLDELCAREDLAGKSILVSTHGAAMTALMNRIRGNVTVRDFWKNQVPPNCAVTMVKVEDGSYEILREAVVFYKEAVRQWKVV